MSEYTLEQLTGMTGVSGRSIRYYISEKLLSPPSTGGKGATYNDSHVQRLKDIIASRQAGMPLAKMRVYQDMTPLPSVLLSVGWDEFQLTDAVRVLIKTGRSPGEKWRITQAMETFAKTITDVNKENE